MSYLLCLVHQTFRIEIVGEVGLSNGSESFDLFMSNRFFTIRNVVFVPRLCPSLVLVFAVLVFFKAFTSCIF